MTCHRLEHWLRPARRRALIAACLALTLMHGAACAPHPLTLPSDSGRPPVAGGGRGAPTELADQVDPFIGTDGHGHTFPGATLPFGMVQLSPDTRLEGWDGCSGYHYSDEHIYGFSHTHLSGTGVADYCDVLFMPTVGAARWHNGADDAPGYRSRFSHAREHAAAGHYEVHLQDLGVDVELTATERVGLHRYTFPPGAEPGVLIDLVHRDPVREAWIEVMGPQEIRGYRRSSSWATDQHVYFAARFSAPVIAVELREAGASAAPPRVAGAAVQAHLRFALADGADTVIEARVALSAVSAEGAARNLDAEASASLSFDAARGAAREAWNRQLAKITVEGGTAAQHTIFTTALYHACLAPNLFMDVDGRYRGMDGAVHQAEGWRQHTVFSLWDTYRALHPLLAIIERARTTDFIHTFLAHYREGGALPVWELAANETHCMIGYHAVPVIADAYARGIRGFDAELALEAMVHSALQEERGLGAYRRQGFVPANEEGESVSKTLEYATDDACIALLAAALGRNELARTFAERAQYYRNLFDPQTGFFRARQHHAWFAPFDPAEVNFHYTEANAWQYAFAVPHDVRGLAQLLGGPAALAARLDALFTAPAQLTGRDQPDITGLIGQYAHGNEPSHHVAYLYAYVGQPWKTQARVRQILTELYSDQPDGLCGNEDCGQMSAWYVLSALGFYPVAPGVPEWVLGAPLFPRATLRLENGNHFTVRAENADPDHRFVQSVHLNGVPLTAPFLAHDAILAGGELVFRMGPSPHLTWGAALRASSNTDGNATARLVPVPFLARGAPAFEGSTTVALECAEAEAAIFYTRDEESQPVRYRGPFVIDSTTTIRAHAERDGRRSLPLEVTLRAVPGGRSIRLATRPASQYSAGGERALIDSLRGGQDFRTGGWQGYWEVDLDATIDLGAPHRLEAVRATFLQDMKSWIWLPVAVEFSHSLDGVSFTSLGVVTHDVDERAPGAIRRELGVAPAGTPARYLRVLARNRRTCPDWHPGAGNPAWIFADEVSVETRD